MIAIGFGMFFILLGLALPHGTVAFLLGVILTAIGVGRFRVKQRGKRRRQAEEAELRAYQLRAALRAAARGEEETRWPTKRGHRQPAPRPPAAE